MRRRKRSISWLMTGLVLAGLGIGGVRAGPLIPAEAATGTLTITLEAGDYTLHEGSDGQTHIQMTEDFGSLGAPGEPQLPGRAFLIALPPGAQVTDVHFDTPAPITLPGRYQIAPVEPLVSYPEDADQAMAQWEANRTRVYATDDPFPSQVGEYLGQGQWRRYTTARVAFQPFSYRPLSGALHFHPTLAVTIEYQLAEPGSPAWREFQRLRDDRVLDDLISGHLVNFDQAQAWYDGFSAEPLTTANSLYDYVIVVENDTMAAAVAPFKTWKESLGHTVNVVTLDWIHANYPGIDVAEEVWSFLHDKYPSSEWGIRYVMLVGDLKVIPTRRVYYADKGWGLRSDHFFAKLSGGATGEQVWNSDGDVRWGEVHDDEMTVEPDVLVGRIPLTDATEVGTAVQAMITFEQDDGAWKHSALMGAGYVTIHNATNKRDAAVLTEYTREYLLEPNGWTYTRIYEQSGVGTSTYTGTIDYDTSRTNVVAAWNGSDHGLVILSDHGNWAGLSGVYWKADLNKDGDTWDAAAKKDDPGEIVWEGLFSIWDVPSITNTHPAIVELLGCFTLQMVTSPWPMPDQTMSDPGGYTKNTGGELLAHGAAAGVVGFYSPAPASSPAWTIPTNNNGNTFISYFNENLIQNHYTLGWSLFETKIRYMNNWYSNSYQPFHWSFTLFGDPSMILEGYDDSAQDSNKTIHTGHVYAYGTDNADDGDMYVAVSTRPETQSGEIKVHKSTNHGETWNHWATVTHTTGIRALDVVAAEWQHPYSFLTEELVHVFFTDTAGRVIDAQISMADPAYQWQVIIPGSGATGENIPRISAARDPLPMPSTFYIYVTWEVDLGTSHRVNVTRSTDNGTLWVNPTTYNGYQQPHVDAGPSDHVYLTAVADAFPNHVHVNRSTNRGANWGNWTNLTSGDDADQHANPVVAASTDAARPTVWVAYGYYETAVAGGADLRFAYSKDGGNNWTKNRILSAEQGVDESLPDMVGYRAGPSRWMNIAYDHDQSARTNVVWRWVSGSLPNNWWAPRPLNDHDAAITPGPQVIYSPGAAATGSGVVYPGIGAPASNLYFAAPWLTVTAGASSSSQMVRSSPAGPASASPQAGGPASPMRPQTEAQAQPLGWAFTGQAGQAFRVAGLARSPDGALYAAATTSEVDGANTGTVFRSDNGGETWEPVPPLPLAWWLESILMTDAGTLLVGGMKYDPSDPGAVAQGVIYRSTDMGEHWAAALESPDAAVVNTLLQRANGDVVAGAGPGGVILASSDDGEHWERLATPPNAEHVYALLERADGTLYAGGVRVGGSGAVYRLLDGAGWEEAGALDNATAVSALLEDSNRVLYAGASSADDAGRVFRSLDGGGSWQPSEPLGESQAVRALLEGAAGRLYAGVDVGAGWFTSYAYVSEDGGETWQDGGYLFMADAVHDLLLTPDGAVYAASGDTYGVIFRAEPSGAWGYPVYLPLVMRSFQ